MKKILGVIFAGAALSAFLVIDARPQSPSGPSATAPVAVRPPKSPAGPRAISVLLLRSDVSTIETTIPVALKPDHVSFSLYKQDDGDASTRVLNEAKVADCQKDGPPAEGAVCMATGTDGVVRIIYRLPQSEKAGKYNVAVDVTDTAGNETAKILNVSGLFNDPQGVVQKYYKAEKTRFAPEIKRTPNGEILVTIKPSTPICLDGETGDRCLAIGSPEALYVQDRLKAIYEWLEPMRSDPSTLGAHFVQVEPLERPIPESGLDYNVTGMYLMAGASKDAVREGKVDLVLITKRNFPEGRYSLKVAFPDGAPAELKTPFIADLSGVLGKPPDASRNDSTLGLRDFKSNLDLALAYTTSVNNVPVGNKTVRKRQSNGIVDLMFAPWLNRPIDKDGKYTWTPLFIDSKTSTAPITSTTLSLNRVYIGTQFSMRLLDLNNLDKYIFTFKGVNASDRDFKRVEGKFVFDFNPIFRRLNHPLATNYKNAAANEMRQLNTKGVPNPKQELVGWFGYQIQPSVGVEVGDIYRAARNALNIEEQSRYVRRLHFGLAMQFDLTKFIVVKLQDTAYYRGEVTQSQVRNYFYGEMDAPLMAVGDTSQCLFVSYERGDQPPFATPGVNAFRIGYRITSNFFHLDR